MAHSRLVPNWACFVKGKLRHGWMDNLMRVTVPEGRVGTQGSKVCMMLCIPTPTLSQDTGNICWHSQAPREVSLPLLQHQGLLGTHLSSCLLPSLWHSRLSPSVPSLFL